MNSNSSHAQCCVVGGGPAGVMLGYLLARSGVRVTILEKHKDFFRDFRGDTVHPSTLQLMHELGLADDLLCLPHQKVTSARASFGGVSLEIANIGGLRVRYPFVALMPQWDFLNFLSERGREYPGFDLRMEHEAVDLILRDERIQGVVVRTPRGTGDIEADLVIGCGGRHSAVRTAASLEKKSVGVPIDVLWFRISRGLANPGPVLVGNINYGRVLILLNRGEYFQAGLIIPKNSFEQIRQEGMEAFRARISQIAPYLGGHVEELKDWEQIKLLSVQINRLRRWYRPGLLCIGDAAHAMSPAFGVGINLAIQDAVATANLLNRALRNGANTDALLEQVQRRREFPMRVVQFLQVIAHKGLERVFRQHGPMRPPLPLKLMVRVPGIQQVMARVVGIGIRPERTQQGPREEIGPRVRSLTAACAGFAAATTVVWRSLTHAMPRRRV